MVQRRRGGEMARKKTGKEPGQVTLAADAGLWQRVKLDPADFFRNIAAEMAKNVADNPGALLDWSGLAGALVKSIKGKDTAEDLAQRLILTALTKATLKLVAELALGDAYETLVVPRELQERLCNKLCGIVESHDIIIDYNFFERPTALPYLADFKKAAACWLGGLAVSDAHARTVIGRFDSAFVHALYCEWFRTPEDYRRLLDHVDSPFRPAWEQEQEWRAYNAWLQAETDASVFGASFGLRQIYVPLRASVPQPDEENGKPQKPRVVASHAALHAWVKAQQSADAIRLISGGPGSGKSSLAKMFAAEISQGGQMRVLFIPLQHFNMKKALDEAVGYFLQMSPREDRANGWFKTNPLHDHTSSLPLLLIFDGLDELMAPSDTADRVAGEFLQELQRTLIIHNGTEPPARLLALVCGRTLSIQSGRMHVRRPEAELILLRYYYTKQERKKEFDDPDKLLAVDQRHVWWQAYVRHQPQEDPTFPKRLGEDDLVELTSEPLLNYLVVLAGVHHGHAAGERFNRNTLYQILLDKVYEQGWRQRTPCAVAGLTREEFGEVMEFIATEAWYGAGRTASLAVIEEKITKSGRLKRLYAAYRQQCGGVQRLVTAFYIRKVEDGLGRDDAIEFTHKSFSEYLTARRLFRELERTTKNLTASGNDDPAWSPEAALGHWLTLTGRTAITKDVLRFLRDEAALPERTATRAAGRQTLVTLINFVQRHGLPAHRLERQDFAAMTAQARNAEETLFCLLNALVLAEEKPGPVVIDWEGEQGVRHFLARVAAPRPSGGWPCIRECLSYLDLSSGRIFGHEVSGEERIASDLSLIELVVTDIKGCNFSGSHLFKANLSGAKLSGANFSGANLSDANLSDANLSGAKLPGVDLSGVILSGVNLSGANLSGANLSNAIFSRSRNFKDGNLYKTHELPPDLEYLAKIRPEWADEDEADEDEEEDDPPA